MENGDFPMMPSPLRQEDRIRKAEDKKELLIPAIKDCILKVDVEAGVMTVHLLEGLR